MGELSARNFGLLIAYLIPGFVALVGVSFASETVGAWLSGAETGSPNVGSFLYVLLASVALGMTVSAMRWALLDSVHHCTGLDAPVWNDERLMERLDAYQFLIEIHYRYYQFYGNSAVALLFAYAMWRASGAAPWPVGTIDAALLLVFCIFLAGSRDTLRKYYRRTAILLGTVEGTVDHDERRPSRDRSEEPLEAGEAPGRCGGEEEQGGEPKAQ